jgi:hypothetical protein
VKHFSLFLLPFSFREEEKNSLVRKEEGRRSTWIVLTVHYTHSSGKYWILSRTVPEDESDEKPAKPMAWDADARARLRREAETANQVLELFLCQRVKDFVVRF